MENFETVLPATWEPTPQPLVIGTTSLWGKFNAFADSQKSNHTLWYIVSLMVHGIFLVPMIGIMTYFYAGPGYIFLTISLLYFFIVMIENMGGASIRATLLCFAASVAVHIAMAAIMLFF